MILLLVSYDVMQKHMLILKCNLHPYSMFHCGYILEILKFWFSTLFVTSTVRYDNRIHDNSNPIHVLMYTLILSKHNNFFIIVFFCKDVR